MKRIYFLLMIILFIATIIRAQRIKTDRTHDKSALIQIGMLSSTVLRRINIKMEDVLSKFSVEAAITR